MSALTITLAGFWQIAVNLSPALVIALGIVAWANGRRV